MTAARASSAALRDEADAIDQLNEYKLVAEFLRGRLIARAGDPIADRISDELTAIERKVAHWESVVVEMDHELKARGE